MKEITRSKFRTFYKPHSEEFNAPVGDFFFDIYKRVNIAQRLLQNAALSTQLKEIVVEACMDTTVRALKARLSPDAIEEQVKTQPPKELVSRVEADLATFSAAFDEKLIMKVDRTYSLVLTFIQFVTFDFFSLVKKFDKYVSPKDMNYRPRCEPVKAAYVIQNIKDFLEIAAPIDPEQDWMMVLNVLKEYRGGVELIPLNQWNSILVQLRRVQNANILPLIVQQVDKNPHWKSMVSRPDKPIAEAYLKSQKEQAQGGLKKIARFQENDQITHLTKLVFGVTDIRNRLKHYSKDAHEMLLKKGTDGFIYTKEMNYVNVFMLDYYKGEIQSLRDIFLIQGQWSSVAVSRNFSDSFQAALQAFEDLVAFDESLATNSRLGARLKSVVDSRNQANIVLNTINDNALNLIVAVVPSLEGVSHCLQELVEDHKKEASTKIVNWKALEAQSELAVIQRLEESIQKLDNFTRIMRLFVPVNEK
ncbi:MAG: DUF5312 family protein [Treponema sp.]|jgi:hypothetical protein|nr:DUF5312 family protein [Treponema sp.]